MASFDQADKMNAIQRYNSRYAEFGYSPKTLGWWTGKQELRFEVLTSHYDFQGKSVLDIGCGFGDLNKTLRRKCSQYRYSGVDFNPTLIAKAKELYQEPWISFQESEFLETSFAEPLDYAIESGIFNHKYAQRDNYEVIGDCMAKAIEVCRDGLAFDFNSDRRPDKREDIFYSSPERILSIAMEFSKNVILRHDYMPYEFAIFVFKDDSFSTEDKIFARYKSVNVSRWQKI